VLVEALPPTVAPSQGATGTAGVGRRLQNRMSTTRANSHNGGLSIQDAAEHVGVAASTLRRWARDGLIPRYDGSWPPGAVSHAKIVARLRDRGHSLQEIRQATEEGRLAYGCVEELFDGGAGTYTLAQASRETGLEPALITRVISALGTAPAQVERISAEEAALLRYVAAVLEAGLPLVALLQLVRVYGQAMARVADAEVRLFHLYVHEPLMRSGATGLETADEMLELTRRLLPLAMIATTMRRFSTLRTSRDAVEGDMGNSFRVGGWIGPEPSRNGERRNTNPR